jgi:hypothetical protein
MSKKENTFVVIVFAVLIVFSKSQGQESSDVKSAYVNSTYRLQYKLFNTYMVNENHKFKLLRPDSLGKILLQKSPEAKKMLRREKIAVAFGSFFGFTGALSALYAPTLALHDNRSSLPSVLFAGGFAMLVVAIPIEIRAANLTNKFIWTLNRDVISNLSDRN